MAINNKLIEFLNLSSSNFHAVKLMADSLKSEGFIELMSSETWDLKMGEKYYVTFNGTALIAFDLNDYPVDGDDLKTSVTFGISGIKVAIANAEKNLTPIN